MHELYSWLCRLIRLFATVLDLTQICSEWGLLLQKVTEANIDKLYSRLERGVIGWFRVEL